MEALSLVQLTDAINLSLAESFPSTYWVRAEIAEMSVKRHAYFELIEKSEQTGQIQAKMRATCWMNIYAMLSAYFLQQTSQMLSAGMKVLIEVEVVFHNVYGISLNIVNIDPNYTLGDLARERQATIDRLKKDGTFDMQRLLSMPLLVKRVAVISSSTAAGYQDFRHQLETESGTLGVSCTLFPATMQGETAAQSIIDAINSILAVGKSYDVIVIVRGGGASVDLKCFDDYMLSSVCSQIPIPIISGIGHTKDVAVLDMVTYASVKTPTAAAELIIAHNMLQVDRLQDIKHKLVTLVANYSLRKKQRLETIIRLLSLHRKHYLDAQRQQLCSYTRTLELLSPEALFRKGYTITTVNGKVVRSSQEVTKGTVITTEWIDGTRKSILQ